LRQEEGLLYHLRAHVVVTRQVLAFELAMVLPVGEVRSVGDFLGVELDRLAGTAVSEAELRLARLALRQDEDERRERGLSLVQEDAWFLLAGWRQEDFYRILDSTTPETLKLKIRQFFRESGMWTVAVGSRSELEEAFAERP
jgi:hypothetical protein